MVVSGILVALSAVFHGVGVVTGKIWDVTKDFISWMFTVMPKPLRFFFFLYFTLFLVALVMPKFLGTGFECDSQGNNYRINMFTLWQKQQYIESLAYVCPPLLQEGTIEGSIPKPDSPFDLVGLFEGWKGIFFTVTRWLGIYQDLSTGNYTSLREKMVECEEWDRLVNTNQTSSKDYALQIFGERSEQKNYEQIVHVGCSQNKDGEWFNTLHFFNIDLFNYELWLIIGIFGAITPFCFKWYRMVLKR